MICKYCLAKTGVATCHLCEWSESVGKGKCKDCALGELRSIVSSGDPEKIERLRQGIQR